MIFIQLALWLVAALAVMLFGSTTGLAAFPPPSAVESAIHGYDETLDPTLASTTSIVNCAGGLRSQVLHVCSRASNDEHHAGAVELAPSPFTGKERDAETGLDYFEARYLSSAQGRFTSPDAPFADQHIGDPQSWNLYSYVRNNPLRYTDPTGRCLRPNETLASCGDYLIGGAKAIGNIPSDIVNAPNRLTNLLISPFTDFQFPDLLPSTFQAANSDQAQGMEAMQVSLAVTPAAEAAAGKLAGMGQGARTAEVVIDSAKSPQAAAHIKDAQAAGHPSVVTLDRSLARPNRKAALADTPAAPKGSGLSRDEYPPACCREGGAGSSVRVIPGRDNSSAGAQFGNQVRQLPDGTKVRIKVK